MAVCRICPQLKLSELKVPAMSVTESQLQGIVAGQSHFYTRRPGFQG